MWSRSFSPQVQPDTRVLVLGSMPGTMSLEKQEYYAHPRNAFWPIVGALFGFSEHLPYHDRLACLNAGKVGLWDVYASCYREGSLDAAIVSATAECNDFVRLFDEFPSIHTVFFNGRAAETAFCKRVLPLLTDVLHSKNVRFVLLPSTSPAHAGMSWAGKLAAWQQVKEAVDAT